MSFSYCTRLMGLLLLGSPIDELRLVKPLPLPTYSWPVPSEVLAVGNAELAEITRITKSIGVFLESPKSQIDTALKVAAPSAAKLCVMFRPWFTPTIDDPLSAAAMQEFGLTWQRWRDGPAKVIAASVYKPEVVCLVDSETLRCAAEPARAKCAELYSSYDAFIRLVAGCKEVHWYGFAENPAPAEPDGYSFQPWAVPFSGIQSLGFEAYNTGEIAETRTTSRRAKILADSLGVPTAAWVSVGCGWRYDWNPFKRWVWQGDPAYSRQMGAELFSKWFRERPNRFHSPPSVVILYPSILDIRIIDHDWRVRLSFLHGAVD
jgi:hypothetical protein